MFYYIIKNLFGGNTLLIHTLSETISTDVFNTLIRNQYFQQYANADM